MFELHALEVDPVKAKEGTWINYLGGAELFICRYNCEAAEKARMDAALEHPELFGVEELPEDKQEEANEIALEIENRILADHILKDWKGITVGGKELKYTPEVGYKYLSDPRFVDFREDVVRLSRSRASFRSKTEEEAIDRVKEAADS